MVEEVEAVEMIVEIHVKELVKAKVVDGATVTEIKRVE